MMIQRKHNACITRILVAVLTVNTLFLPGCAKSSPSDSAASNTDSASSSFQMEKIVPASIASVLKKKNDDSAKEMLAGFDWFYVDAMNSGKDISYQPKGAAEVKSKSDLDGDWMVTHFRNADADWQKEVLKAELKTSGSTVSFTEKWQYVFSKDGTVQDARTASHDLPYSGKATENPLEISLTQDYYGNTLTFTNIYEYNGYLYALGTYSSAYDKKPGYAAMFKAVEKTSKPAENPVSGNRITEVPGFLYMIKEDDLMYTNIQWAKALLPEFGDYIPKDIPELDAPRDNYVNINGNNVEIELGALASVTPVVFTDLENGNVSPASVPDDEIEVIYGFRDGITLYGTITDYGITREMDPEKTIYYSKYSEYYDENKYTDNPVYYVNGTIDRIKNNVKSENGFTSGYRRTVYNNEDMYALVTKKHETTYTYPGITQKGSVPVFDHGELVEYRDAEYQAFSRFQILYYPDEDLFRVEVMLLDHGTIEAEGSDGNGRHEQDSAETDFVYQMVLLSDYRKFRDVEEEHEYMVDNYIIVEK